MLRVRSFSLGTLFAMMAVPIIGLVQSAGQLPLATTTVGPEVMNRESPDAGIKFRLSVGKLSRFTKIIGGEG